MFVVEAALPPWRRGWRRLVHEVGAVADAGEMLVGQGECPLRHAPTALVVPMQGEKWASITENELTYFTQARRIPVKQTPPCLSTPFLREIHHRVMQEIQKQRKFDVVVIRLHLAA